MPTFVGIRSLERTPALRVRTVSKLGTPSGLAAAAVGTGGTFAAATYFWKVTAVGSGGETPASNEATVAIVLNGKANLTWTAVPNAVSYNIYRGTSSNGENKLVGTSTTNAFSDTGVVGTTQSPPTANTSFVYAAAEAPIPVGQEVIVNLDDAATRKTLARHNTIGQYIVTSANASTSTAGTLPSNS